MISKYYSILSVDVDLFQRAARPVFQFRDRDALFSQDETETKKP